MRTVVIQALPYGMAFFGHGGGSRGVGGGQKNLVEFRAGKLNLKGRMLYADKRKGLVYVQRRSEEGLMHFCWKDRTTGVLEDVRSKLCGCVLCACTVVTEFLVGCYWCQLASASQTHVAPIQNRPPRVWDGTASSQYIAVGPRTSISVQFHKCIPFQLQL